jgi:anaerobic ribonucleoside-triphosphate reductase
MKRIKYLALALTLSLMFISIIGCGDSGPSVKDDFKEYVNNNANTIFIPENNSIVKTYTEVIQTQDEKIIIKAISETLPAKNEALLAKMKALTPKTTEVQQLHNIYIKAVELRKEGYVLMHEALTTKLSDESAIDKALNKLGEADIKFVEYETKRTSMMKELGLVDVSK